MERIKMFARLLSDIHFELSRHTGPRLISDLIAKVCPADSPTLEDVLILAGDIGDPSKPLYRDFLTAISNHFALVLVVTGNHEYYQKDPHHEPPSYPSRRRRLRMEEVDAIIADLHIPKVHFLNRTSFIHNRVRFLGCTLWSVPNPHLCQYMNDFHKIPGMTRLEYLKRHMIDRQWLQEQLLDTSPSSTSFSFTPTSTPSSTSFPFTPSSRLQEPEHILPSSPSSRLQEPEHMSPFSDVGYDTTVVITHHVPSLRLLAAEHAANPMNCFFATDLEDLVGRADVWCCGHTHTPIQTSIGTTRCYINPIGYISEHTNWDPNLRFLIHPTLPTPITPPTPTVSESTLPISL